MRWITRLGWASLLLPALMLSALSVQAQTPASPPSCEDRLAATSAYVDLLRNTRDQYEQRVAELAAKIQALERAAAAAAPKPAPAK